MNIFIRPSEFSNNIGSWSIVTGEGGTMEGEALRGRIGTPQEGQELKDAIQNLPPHFPIPAKAVFESDGGEYYLWVRSRDFHFGENYFTVKLNNEELPQKFGVSGKDLYVWEAAGKVRLKNGENILEAIDVSGFFASLESIYFSKEDKCPPETYEELVATLSKDSVVDLPELFPKAVSCDIQETLCIQNETTKIKFYKTSDRIETSISIFVSGKWLETKSRSEDYGYLLLKASSSRPYGRIDDFIVFDQDFVDKGKKITTKTANIYKSAASSWLIPKDMQLLPEGGVMLTFQNDDVDLIVIWELPDSDPKVSLKAKFKTPGAYSFGAFEGKGYTRAEISSVLAPFRMYHRLFKESPGIVNEQFMFTPMSVVTLPNENTKITKGIVVDPEWIPLRWVYYENSKFGMGLIGPDLKIKPTVFAPIFGSAECEFEENDTYDFSYRVINKNLDWYDTYTHVIENLFSVTDYRKNYYTSITDAVLNTTKLMMDDDMSGWDPYDKSFYNMEMRNVTSAANPMEPIQRYLLTEDEDILEKRAIPTIAAMFNRPGLFFSRLPRKAAAEDKGYTTPVGIPNYSFNLNVWAGMHEQASGLTPALYKTGIEKAMQEEVVNTYGSIPSFSDELSLYKYTGEKIHLEKAVALADEYIHKQLNPDRELIHWNNFIYISYYPNIASLIDLYEVTKMQKHLDAAVESARILLTTLWSAGIDSEKKNSQMELSGKEIAKLRYMPNESIFWWHGDKKWRLGNEPCQLGRSKNTNDIPDETVPAWVPSRVGLGLEQPCTFIVDSINIIMSDWAGDLLRLSKYSGDKHFEIAARNAIVGRFGNYPGYYQNRFMTLHQKPEYPYNGPDLTSIYWHHIPPFLAMLENFLVNLAWLWSNENISFPSARQQGYAYFNSNQYGHKSGQFFDQDNMWLWIDEGIITTDNIQADWICARKDGVLGIALMNESDCVETVTVTLKEKALKGSPFSGKAIVWDKNSNKSLLEVHANTFTLKLPPKSLQGVVIEIPTVSAPAYSKCEPGFDLSLGETVTEHENGKGYALQITPKNYFAFVYVTDMEEDTKNVTLNYKIQDQSFSQTTNIYPYEFIIKVDDPQKEFHYFVETKKKDGSILTTTTKTLRAKKIE